MIHYSTSVGVEGGDGVGNIDMVRWFWISSGIGQDVLRGISYSFSMSEGAF